jgi:hypothetical protein
MFKTVTALAAALAILGQQAAWARGGSAPRAELDWDELAQTIVDKEIALVLPDGTDIQGLALAVRPEALVLDVRKTSDRKLHPAGQAAIPRASVRLVKVVRRSGPFKMAGGLLGAFGGILAASGVAAATDSVGATLGALVVGIPALATVGYYAGKEADRRTTLIAVRPEKE